MIEKVLLDLEEERDYYKAKSSSCEEGLFQQDREISKLKKENEELKHEISKYKAYIEGFNEGICCKNRYSDETE